MFEDVVIGWDAGPSAREAADWALDRELGARHRLLRVLDHEPLDRFGRSIPRVELQEAVDELQRERPRLRLLGEFTRGDVERELVRRTGRDVLLVLGGGAGAHDVRWTLPARVARAARGPVVVVPQGATARTGPVVVGVDGTASSRAALLRAAAIAGLDGSPLVLVHAWEALVEDGDAASGISVGEHAEILGAAADEAASAAPDLPIEPRLVHGTAAEALLDAGRAASLVLLGRSARLAPRALLLGSVARAVLAGSPVPVLLTGAQDLPAAARRRVAHDAVAGRP
ncbi:universal stress protein [Amnibacterium kyonggiense]|uniref:Nucleotide-binding universal stress UspA family protein n=1 Tax=Amnibacterium kyonggiense TaxID=595671 RepID=A0A4R7FKL4_9MICO|nr:universal stress protein [Amnibacterium kyonggiense]TDS76887.1 nucleotide-binding universal stress UspA family protein [Amnibacterium kyonggiense]